MTSLTFECRPASPQEREATAQALKAHTEKAIGVALTHEPFGLVASEGGKMAGSVVGKIFFNWLHIDLIWVADGLRGKGMGRELMRRCEQYARERKLSGIEVWTQSWQAPEFYHKLGYEEFAVLDDFTPGRKRHAFRKHLAGA